MDGSDNGIGVMEEVVTARAARGPARAQGVGLGLQAADQDLHTRDKGVDFLYREYFLELMLCQAFALDNEAQDINSG